MKREQLGHILQAANFFLTISNQAVFNSFESIVSTFPALNLAHIKYFLDMYSTSVDIPKRVRNQVDKACAQHARLGKMPLYLPLKLSLQDIASLVGKTESQ